MGLSLHTVPALDETEGLDQFIAMQSFYNRDYQEDERELLPLCQAEGVGVMPFRPLIRVYLARPAENIETTTRGAVNRDRRQRWILNGTPTIEITTCLQQLAAEKNLTMAQRALAWLLHHDWARCTDLRRHEDQNP